MDSLMELWHTHSRIKFTPRFEKKTPRSYREMDKCNLFPGQFLYIIDMANQELAYHRNMDQMLGYPASQIDLSLLYTLFHPDDAPKVIWLTKSTLDFVYRHYSPEAFQTNLLVDYRIRKKDGTYMRILRQSTVYDTDDDGRIVATLSLCTDITQIKPVGEVKWQVTGMKNVGDFQAEGISSADRFNFSNREKEIIKLVATGKSSETISKELKISINTVNTHRRNILKKAGMHNTAEIVKYGIETGILEL